ncbi:MAG: hypothetical protein R6W77_14635 [Trueperaceae bacterium]
MNTRKIVITGIAALIAFAAGYGLLGMAAPTPPDATATDIMADATLQAVLANVGNAGDLPANVIVVDAPTGDGSGRSVTGADDDAHRRYDDHGADYDDDHDDDDDYDDDEDDEDGEDGHDDRDDRADDRGHHDDD